MQDSVFSNLDLRTMMKTDADSAGDTETKR